MSMLCIENGCLTRQEYKDAAKRIATLVKNDGTLLLYTSIRNREETDNTPGYYYVGEEKYIQVALPLEFVQATLTECGFDVIKTNKLPEKESDALGKIETTDLESTAFIIATKL